MLCYRTLADVACYDRPDEGRDGRLVGFYLRPEGEVTDKETALRWAKARVADEDE